jgi:hypothetical protein
VKIDIFRWQDGSIPSMKNISIPNPYLQVNHPLCTRTMWIIWYSGKYVTQIRKYYKPVKEKITPWHAYAGTEGRQRYSANALANSMLEEGGWFTPWPSRLNPRKGPMSSIQEAEWAWDRFRRVRKILFHRDSTSGPSNPQRVVTPHISYLTDSMCHLRTVSSSSLQSQTQSKFLKSIPKILF